MAVTVRNGLHRFLIAVLALSALGAVVRGQTEVQVVRQVRLSFRANQETADNLASKRSALQAAADFDSPQIARTLIRAYGVLDREAGPLETRRQELLLRGGGSKMLAPLRRRLQPIHNLQRRIIEVLDGLRARQSVGAMVEALIKPKRRHPFSLRLALSKRAGDLAEADRQLVTKVKAKLGPEDRVLLCRALASLGKRAVDSVDWVVRQMAHDSIDVRIEAVKALGFLAAPKSLAPLVDRLDAERGRVRDEVVDTLQRLTGANPGPASQSWRLWLGDAGQAFVKGDKPLGGKKPVARQASRRQIKATGSYFGIPQDGNSILYVFDNSKSMQAKMPGTTGVTRMDRCRAELHKALDGLTPTKTFNLVCFANKLRRFDDRMLAAIPQNLARAHKWIDSIPLELQTNTYDSLEHAFQIAGRGTVDRQYPVVADTIFFLSDGAPTAKGLGTLVGDNVKQILAAVQRWNPLRRVVIHSIGLGIGRGNRKNKKQASGSGPRAFLVKLAEQNGGRFVNPK